MATGWAMQLAASVWCKEATRHKQMDVTLAEEFAEILDEVRADFSPRKIVVAATEIKMPNVKVTGGALAPSSDRRERG